jgi:hypothetical protein
MRLVEDTPQLTADERAALEMAASERGRFRDALDWTLTEHHDVLLRLGDV